MASLSAAACLCAWLAGCMTPEKAEREADETAVALATEMWRRQTGCTNAFDIARPADVLTLRIALEAVRQGVTNAVFPRIEGVDPLVLNPRDTWANKEAYDKTAHALAQMFVDNAGVPVGAPDRSAPFTPSSMLPLSSSAVTNFATHSTSSDGISKAILDCCRLLSMAIDCESHPANT